MPTRRQTLLSVITAAVWQMLPRGAQAAERDLNAFNAAFGEKIAIPFLTGFEQAAAGLSEAADALKAKPGADSLAGVIKGFGDVSDAWMAVQVLRFGPMTQNQRLDRIAYWPERSNMTEKQLTAFIAAADPAKLQPDAFSKLSVAVQGLSGLERLLFDSEHTATGKPASDKALAQLTSGDKEAAYRLDLIKAIAVNLEAIGKEGAAAWHALSAKLKKGDAAGFAASPQEATNQIYAGLVTIAQALGSQKLGLALGKGPEASKPHQAEQWRAGRSLRDIEQNLAALKQGLTGDPAGSAIALVTDAATAAELKKKVETTYADCIQAIVTVSQPLDLAVADEKARGQVQALLVKINQFRDILTNDMPKAAGITLGFNDLDGDGG